MLNDETRRKLRILNVGEFIEELEIQQQDPQTLALPFDDRFQLLTDGVYQRKYNDKVRRLIKNAKFRLPKADIHDILYIDDYSGPLAHPGRSLAQLDRASAHSTRSAVQPMLAADQHTC